MTTYRYGTQRIVHDPPSRDITAGQRTHRANLEPAQPLHAVDELHQAACGIGELTWLDEDRPEYGTWLGYDHCPSCDKVARIP